MITGIILASGFSKRMGQDKLLMDVKGMKMVEWIIRSSKASALDKIILVYRNEEVGDIGDRYDIKTIYNPHAHLGQAESLKVGVKAADGSEAYMFLPADQPFVASDLIDHLIDEYRNNKDSIILPYYKGKKGTPNIFPSKFRDELLNVHGDKGGRDIIKKNPSSIRRVNIEDEKLGIDIDTDEDFKRFL